LGEEISDRLALPEESAAEPSGPAPARLGWDEDPDALIVEPLTKIVGGESWVGEQRNRRRFRSIF
jgi:hypothetical protein